MTLSASRLALGLALLTAPMVAAAQSPWALVARRAIGRVEQLAQTAPGAQPASSFDVATVLLDAPAEAVFATVASMARRNPAVRITAEDSARHRIDVMEGDRSASLMVNALGDDVSQLVIAGTAGRGEDATSSHVVATVLRICAQMQKQCSAER